MIYPASTNMRNLRGLKMIYSSCKKSDTPVNIATNTEIISPLAKEKPLKHKIYQRWFWGDWKHGQPIGKGILYLRNKDDMSIFYEGEFDG